MAGDMSQYQSTSRAGYYSDSSGWWAGPALFAALALTGLGALSGQTWARVVGIILAGLSAIANFLFIPYYSLWSMMIIALDVFVIWALAVHGWKLRQAG
jgi:hypothetical protein